MKRERTEAKRLDYRPVDDGWRIRWRIKFKHSSNSLMNENLWIWSDLIIYLSISWLESQAGQSKGWWWSCIKHQELSNLIHLDFKTHDNPHLDLWSLASHFLGWQVEISIKRYHQSKSVVMGFFFETAGSGWRPLDGARCSMRVKLCVLLLKWFWCRYCTMWW